MGTSGEHESWARPYVDAAGGHAEPGEAAGAYGEASAAYGEPSGRTAGRGGVRRAQCGVRRAHAAYGDPAGHAQPAAYAQPTARAPAYAQPTAYAPPAGYASPPHTASRCRDCPARKLACPPTGAYVEPAPTQPVPEPRVALHEGAAAPGAYMRASTEPTGHAEEVTLAELLNGMLEAGASDLHLTAGAPAADPPQRRARPRSRTTRSSRRRSSSGVIYAVLTQKQREKFEEELELDFAYSVPGRGPLPREHLPPARLARRGVPPHPVRDQDARGPRRPAGGRELRGAAPWLRPGHRPDRLRQVDDARRR